MKKAIVSLMMSALLVLTFSGCKKATETVTPSTQNDSQTAMAIYSAFGTVFSQLQFTPLKGTSGNVNQTIPGPNGGNVVVTGTATMNQQTGVVNWDISLNWNNFKVIQGNDNYTMNGVMSYSGYISGTGASCHFTATNFGMNGTVNGQSMSGNISYTFDVTINGQHGTISGNINGNSFSYSF